MNRTPKRLIPVLIVTACLTATVTAQQPQQLEIQTIPVAKNVYMLVGPGGNIGLSAGEDGPFLIDDQFAPLTDKITAAVKKVSDGPIRFVVNTHWHQDHTAGNENFKKAGAIIVAHQNVRTRMSEEQTMRPFGRRVPPSPEGALPVITFTDSITFHWNGDELRVLHLDPGHTDGDSIIHFRKANVLHLGDIFFNEMYPFIDVSAGGSIDGMVRAVDRALELTNEETKIIPGHGPLSDVEGLRAYRTMLETVGRRVHAMVEQGKSRDEVIAGKPTKDFDAEWGGGFLQPDPWVGIVYDGMSGK
ncbi:MAG TPA: MBL fold metallo-hydrolase [Phycisphaerae bacterium]|nr:MBL fold metallo-hydrolase [Phycisphaerae bacterium]